MNQTQTTKMPESARQLILDNENNRFACDVFAQITLAPPTMEESGKPANLIGKTFFIDVGTDKLFVELIDYEVNAFMWINNIYTYLCCGMDEKSWKEKIKAKYPHVHDKTRFAVYLYKKI